MSKETIKLEVKEEQKSKFKKLAEAGKTGETTQVSR